MLKYENYSFFLSIVQFRIPPNAKEGKSSRNDPEYLIVIDFEATCEEKNYPDYPHEIIEFPAIIIRVDDVQVPHCLFTICRFLSRAPRPISQTDGRKDRHGVTLCFCFIFGYFEFKGRKFVIEHARTQTITAPAQLITAPAQL